MDEFTPKENWIGGREGETSFDALKRIMQSLEFELCEQETKELPFVIREHRRKYQFGVSEMTVWRYLGTPVERPL